VLTSRQFGFYSVLIKVHATVPATVFSRLSEPTKQFEVFTPSPISSVAGLIGVKQPDAEHEPQPEPQVKKKKKDGMSITHVALRQGRSGTGLPHTAAPQQY